VQHLSDAQWHLLADEIRDRHLALVVSIVGEDAVSPADLKRLRKRGLVPKKSLRLPLRAYEFGLISAASSDPDFDKMSFNTFLKRVIDGTMPLTAEEKATVREAERSAAVYIRGLGNTLDKATGQILVEADKSLRRRLQGRIKKEILAGIEKRKTHQQVATALGQVAQNVTRDWHRVAATEMHNSFLEGRAAAIQARNKGRDPLVFKRPRPDCCEHCRKLYLEKDRETPRIFHLSELAANGSNVGRAVGLWKPTVGVLHPHCQCILHELPPGFQFRRGGQMVYIGATGS
jgi:hypothetical protein